MGEHGIAAPLNQAGIRYRAVGGCPVAILASVIPIVLAMVFMQNAATPAVQHARGTFDVQVKPLTATLEGTGRYSLDKHFHGDLEGTSKGEMFGAGDPKKGEAGYVAIEVVTGTIAGKHGSFALQHSSTMDKSGMHMDIKVSPGSGSGDFVGISGTFTIIIEGGKHSYDFEYSLPK